MIGTLRSVVLDCREPHRLACQYSPHHQPPQFPDPAGSQQMHLDDPDVAQRQVLALGATRVTDAVGENNFRVFRDPAGFRSVWCGGSAEPGARLKRRMASYYTFFR